MVSAFALIVRRPIFGSFAQQQGIRPQRISTISRSSESRLTRIMGWKV
jgi:hypothetical protein